MSGILGVALLVLSATQTPAPSDTALDRARRQIEEIYAARLDKARTATQQAELAREMMAAAEGIEDDPAGQFSLLFRARKLAIAANERELALEITSELASRFKPREEIDPAEHLKRADECLQAAKGKRAGEALGLQVSAVEHYYLVRCNAVGLYRQVAEKRLDDFMRSLSKTAAASNSDTLVVWNTHNGDYGGRGTRQFDVSLSLKGKPVWERKAIAIDWERDKNPKVSIPLPRKAWDVIRLSITKWEGVGGGLCEIQIFRRGKNIALRRPARANALYQPTVATPAAAVDGVIDPEVNDKGYWLLPSQTAGWIEIYVGG